MSQEFVLYVDFDATLYDTGRFSADLFGLIARQASVPIDEVTSTIGKFFSDPILGGYDYQSHALSYGLDPEIMWQKLDKLTQNNDYLYPDSVPFMQAARQAGFEPKILSFGEERFQMTKILPTLDSLSADAAKQIEATVVDRKKHQHIRKLHPGQKGALIDDVAGQELPDGFYEIHINRRQKLREPTKKEGSYTVSDLMQALKVVTRLTSREISAN